jgi:AcrR family transcriptional regulator
MQVDLSTTQAPGEPIAHHDGPRTSVDDLLGTARTGTARTERSRRTRAALVAGVRDELRATGTFTADTVAERASCSVATFYSHFATKDDALASAFELVLVDLADIIETTLTVDALRGDGLEAAVETWADRQVEFFRDESLVFRAALARLPFHRGIRHAYREAERVAMQHLVTVVAEGQSANVIGSGDPAELAEAFLVLSQGLNNPHAIRPEADAMRVHLRRALVAALAPMEGSP